MKISCPSCKTEYSVQKAANQVECVCCGCVWNPSPRTAANSLLIFLASITALLAAIAFAIAAVMYSPDKKKDFPLVAKVESVRTIEDAFGVSHLVVSGRVENNSDKIFGVPHLLIMMKDKNGDVIATQKFMPPATLLDEGESVEFVHTLAESADGAKQVSVELEVKDE